MFTSPIDHSLVLIVDDEPFFRMALRLNLEQQGYQVVEAENGTEAVTVFRQLHPDIVLLDILMPDMDGIECCQQLQSLNQQQQTPVLMLTVVEEQQLIERAFSSGAADYLIKPFYWPLLHQRLKRLIRQSQRNKQLISENLQLQQLVATDFLTQIANRRRFEECLYVEWQRMARLSRPLSLILCDLDFFKSYNDTYGHLMGDRCLVEVASTIKNLVKRPADLVARYGGEEFAVILPDTDSHGATHITMLICSAIRALAIPHPNSPVSSYVTVSAGAATLIPVPGSNFEQLIAAADQALYLAKANGRDRFELISK